MTTNEPMLENSFKTTQEDSFCSEFCESSFEKYNSLRQMHLKKQEDAKLELEISSSTSSKMALKWQDSLAHVKLTKVNDHSVSNEKTNENSFQVVIHEGIDKRTCVFCHQTGDLNENGPGRLLTMDIGNWCHLNCSLWSNDVYETMAGAFINVDAAYKRSINIQCGFCHKMGASIKCFMQKCNNYYHLSCAMKEKCSFTHDKVSL